MAEYIEREALRSKAVYMYGFGENKYIPLKAVESAPAADVAPVRHGRWIVRNKGMNNWVDCSECGTVGSPHWKCCPVCEAKMGGDG